MEKPEYIYDLDDRPPLRLALLYALQWAFIIFPIFIASAVLPARVLQLGPVEELRFLQLILLSSGVFTTIQCLWGHRYPIIEGPSGALLLTFLVIAPYGLPALQAGAIAGGLLLMAAVIIVKPKRIIPVMTPNVVGVILMLISLTLLPYMGTLMSGAGSTADGGSAAKFLLSVMLVLLMSAMAYRLKGFFKTIWLLLGMLIGTALFFALEHPSFSHILSSSWLSIPQDIIPSRPQLTISAVVAFAVSYVAVAVNSIGSIQAIAHLTNRDRLSEAIPRGLFINGVAGVLCGLMGIVGHGQLQHESRNSALDAGCKPLYSCLVRGAVHSGGTYSKARRLLHSRTGSGRRGCHVHRSEHSDRGCPGNHVNAGIEERSYYIVGLPVVLGTLIGFVPQNIVNELPQAFRVFLGNGLTFGIVLVLFLEHVLMRRSPRADRGGS
jgi:uracil permease